MQLAYTDAHPNARAGLVHTRERDQAYIQGEASAEIAFGRFVALKAGAQDGLEPIAVLPSATLTKLVGAVEFTHVYNRETALGSVGVKPSEALKVLEAGLIWVEVETAVAVDDKAHVRLVANGAATKIGIVRNAADSTNTVALGGSRFRTAASANGIALLEFDIRIYHATRT